MVSAQTQGMHQLEIFGIHLMEMLFLVGLAGSAVVVAISFVEDLGELFESDEPHGESMTPHTPQS